MWVISRVTGRGDASVGFSFPSMAFAPIPIVVRWISRRALRWYYRELHFVGSERIPVDGAVMLFGNHPNDLPDVLAGYFTTERPVRYVATISAAVSPLAKATYRGLGVIPVARVRDARKMKANGVDAASVNRAAFQEVERAFGAGNVVGVFPEGGVHDVCKVSKPRAGVSKMALDSLNTGAINDIRLVAFGMQYEAPSMLRSDVLVLIGEPVSLAAWKERVADPHPNALTEQLHQAMMAVTRNSDSWTDAAARDQLVAAISAVLADLKTPLLATSAMVQRLCGELVGTNAEAISHDGESMVQWRTVAEPLADWVEKAGGCRTSARDTARVIDAAGWVNGQADWPSSAWMVLVSLPACIGLALHYPLFQLVKWVARRNSLTRADLAARAILPGLHLIFLGYLVLGGIFALGLRAAGASGWWAIPMVMLLPRLGDVGLAWRDAQAALALQTRVRRWPEAHRMAVCAAAARVKHAWTTLSVS